MQDTAELFFDDCRVPVGNLLGKEGQGFRYLMEMLRQERLEVCIKRQVNAEECLKEALRYAQERKAFGRRIGGFQANAFRRTLADRGGWRRGSQLLPPSQVVDPGQLGVLRRPPAVR